MSAYRILGPGVLSAGVRMLWQSPPPLPAVTRGERLVVLQAGELAPLEAPTREPVAEPPPKSLPDKAASPSIQT